MSRRGLSSTPTLPRRSTAIHRDTLSSRPTFSRSESLLTVIDKMDEREHFQMHLRMSARRGVFLVIVAIVSLALAHPADSKWRVLLPEALSLVLTIVHKQLVLRFASESTMNLLYRKRVVQAAAFIVCLLVAFLSTSEFTRTLTLMCVFLCGPSVYAVALVGVVAAICSAVQYRWRSLSTAVFTVICLALGWHMLWYVGIASMFSVWACQAFLEHRRRAADAASDDQNGEDAQHRTGLLVSLLITFWLSIFVRISWSLLVALLVFATMSLRARQQLRHALGWALDSIMDADHSLERAMFSYLNSGLVNADVRAWVLMLRPERERRPLSSVARTRNPISLRLTSFTLSLADYLAADLRYGRALREQRRSSVVSQSSTPSSMAAIEDQRILDRETSSRSYPSMPSPARAGIVDVADGKVLRTEVARMGTSGVSVPKRSTTANVGAGTVAGHAPVARVRSTSPSPSRRTANNGDASSLVGNSEYDHVHRSMVVDGVGSAVCISQRGRSAIVDEDSVDLDGVSLGRSRFGEAGTAGAGYRDGHGDGGGGGDDDDDDYAKEEEDDDDEEDDDLNDYDDTGEHEPDDEWLMVHSTTPNADQLQRAEQIAMPFKEGPLKTKDHSFGPLHRRTAILSQGMLTLIANKKHAETVSLLRARVDTRGRWIFLTVSAVRRLIRLKASTTETASQWATAFEDTVRALE